MIYTPLLSACRRSVSSVSTIGLTLLCVGLWSVPLRAQDTLSYTLPAVEIEATRGTETQASAPFSVSVLTRSAETIALEAPIALTEVLRGLPGIWINDRSHFAVGERLSIRGMGWRAAFGVRGVQVLLDGIPLTLPDGQAFMDIVDPSIVRRAELVRGPSSLFWGNGSGGVLFLSTFDTNTYSQSARARVAGGSHGLLQLLGESHTTLGNHQVQAFASYNEREGYRNYSTGHFFRSGVRAHLNLRPSTALAFTLALADQDTESPGSLTADQLAEDPRLADPRNVDRRAGKESFQAQFGSMLTHQTSFGELTATAYGIVRDLENPLSFAYIGLDRVAGGARVVLQNNMGPFSWGTGLDYGVQQDDRKNWNNENGQPGDDLRLDQRETVRNASAFGYASYDLTNDLALSAGLRADFIRFEMEDFLFTNDDQSGNRTFSALSPGIGLRYQLNRAFLYTNLRTAFETPTTTELVNRPNLDGGFNPDLDPQRVTGFEVGSRGIIQQANLFFDVALFYLQVDDRLLPGETEDGRTFYRNAEGNTHTGAEVALQWQPSADWSLDATYTAARYLFDEGTFDANRLPGIPDHHVLLGAQFSPSEWHFRLVSEWVAAYYVDDANTTENDSYFLLDLHIGHADLLPGNVRVQPFFAIQNLLDTTYNGSVIVNAFGGRYFEPAPGRTFRAGINLSL